MEGRGIMTRPTKSQPRHRRPLVFDSTLKELVQQQASTILPVLLRGATYVETLDVERIRPTMRVDRVYKIIYRRQEHILHLEFESGADNDLPARLHTYHAILYQDYHLPVISMIIYPFRVAMAASPWREMSGDEEIVSFRFRVLPLFTLDAEYYLREHLACMYPLLPTMQNVNREVIGQALDELVALYRDDEVTLAQQFAWMEILLERASMVPPQEKDEIQRRLSMYDKLWEEHPRVKKIKAEVREEKKRARMEGLAEGRAEGLAEGRAEGLAEGRAEGLAEIQAEKERIRAELQAEREQILAQIQVEKERLARQVAEQARQVTEQVIEQRVLQAQLQLRRKDIMMVVKMRFPALRELAQEKIEQIDEPGRLDYLFEQLLSVPDETFARWLLNPPVA